MDFKLILVIISILFLVSACSVTDRFFNNSAGSSSGKGIVLTIKEAPKQGSTLTENDNFAVVVDVASYVKSDRTINGRLCIRDSSSGAYGGIPSSQCINVDLEPPDEAEGKLFALPERIRFPSQGFYYYKDLRQLPVDNQILLDFYYELLTESGAVACIAMPNVENVPSNCKGSQALSVHGQDAPVEVTSIAVTPNTISINEVNLKIDITLRKTEEGTLYPPGKALSGGSSPGERIKFAAFANRQALNCQSSSSGFVEFRQDQKEKIIKCTSSLKLQQEFENLPVEVVLEYGFKKIHEGPQFKMKKEEFIA